MARDHSGPMAGRTVLVTGASGGIGKATAAGLATMGAHLAITGRDPGRTESAARELRTAGGGRVDVFVADLSAQAEVRRLADDVMKRLPGLDVLVNNVGGYWNTRHVTVDGLERTFALNHLAPFLLTNLLMDRLKGSGPARVVTVSSQAHRGGRIDFDDLQGERSYSGARAYNQSKLANVLFTYELARRSAGTAVTANAVHPGVVRTSFGAEDPAGVQRFLVPLIRPFMKSPARGAATSVFVASAPGLEEVTGRYFANSAPRKSSEPSYDQSAAARLWRVSADAVGLLPSPDPPVTSPRLQDKGPGDDGRDPAAHRETSTRGLPVLAREAADRMGADLLTSKAGPTANQKRLRPLSRRENGLVNGVELRGLEPLTPTLPVWCATSCATAPCPVRCSRSRWQLYRAGAATRRRGDERVSALHLRNAEVVAEGVAQAEVDAVGLVDRLLGDLDALLLELRVGLVRVVAAEEEVAAGRTLAEQFADLRRRLLAHRGRPRDLEEDAAGGVPGDVDGQPAHEAEVDVLADLHAELADVEVQRLVLVGDVDLRGAE
jgi:retinol dehydrogenase-14